MARCLLCKVEGWNRPEEWLFTEFHGPAGNKYGVYCPGHEAGEIAASLVWLAEQASVRGAWVALTHEEMQGEIRRRRVEMDAAVVAGTLEKPRALTTDRKGPSIKGGPEGWRKDGRD